MTIAAIENLFLKYSEYLIKCTVNLIIFERGNVNIFV